MKKGWIIKEVIFTENDDFTENIIDILFEDKQIAIDYIENKLNGYFLIVECFIK